MAEVTFGEWLRRQRKAAGWTQEQLAQQLICSTSALKKIEGEERRPSAQIVEKLAEIFNIPPNERKAFLRFARGDWKAAPSESTQEAPWRASAASPRSNLPASLTSLIGREQELARLAEYLSNPGIRLITLIGPPGIGKTSLSLQVGRNARSDFADGIFFVALAPLTDPNLVAPTIAQTLGFVEIPNQAPVERLKHGIGEKQMLIVLDNVEHLIEVTAALVSDILPACPRLKILTTSREALRIPGEWLFFVSPLTVPTEIASLDTEAGSQFSALTLFAERARAVQPDFALNAVNIQRVAQICTQLDGLPLAIELIAARIRLMSPASLLSHWNEQFILSSEGMRAVAPRQQTLSNAIGWSYELLPDKERVLFRRLAAFAGGWTVQEAQAICSGDGMEAQEIPSLLMHLADKSLVVLRGHATGERYHALETIRQYAQEKLMEFHEEEQVRNRHLDYFTRLAEESEPKLHSAEQITWLKQLETEQDNFRGALRWGLGNRAEAGFRLVSALWLFWFMHAHFIEGRQWYDEALSSAEDVTPYVRMRLLVGAASNAMGRGDFEQLAGISEQSLALSREQANQWGLAMSLHHLGISAWQQGEFEKANTLLEEGLARSQKAENWAIASYILGDLGHVARAQGDHKKARGFVEESLALVQKYHDKWSSSYSLANLAHLVYQQSDYRRAKALTQQAMTLVQEAEDRRHISWLLELMGMVALRQGKPERAARLISNVEALDESIGINLIYEEDDIVVRIREQLGDAAFETLAAEGRAMTLEQAVAYALEDSDAQTKTSQT